MIDEEITLLLQEAYRSGHGLKDLCKEHNLSLNDVMRTAKLEKWQSPPQRKRLPPPIDDEDEEDIDPKEYLRRMQKVSINTLAHIEELPPEDVIEKIPKIEAFDKMSRRNFGLDQQQSGPLMNINILAQGLQNFVLTPQENSDRMLPECKESLLEMP